MSLKQCQSIDSFNYLHFEVNVGITFSVIRIFLSR